MPTSSGIFAALVDATGTGAFSDVVRESAAKVAQVDEVFAYCLDPGGDPRRIVSSGRVGSSQMRADLYTTQFHALDPLAAMGHERHRQIHMARLSTRGVPDSLYRRECFERPGFSEKIAFAHTRGARNFVLNFYCRSQTAGACLAALGDLAEIVFPLLSKHCELMGEDAGLPIVTRIERRLGLTYPLLSRREREVCARTLVGMTAEAIALDLVVSETTVLTYRRRAYERYNLSSAHEMVGRILF